MPQCLGQAITFVLPGKRGRALRKLEGGGHDRAVDVAEGAVNQLPPCYRTLHRKPSRLLQNHMFVALPHGSNVATNPSSWRI